MEPVIGLDFGNFNTFPCYIQDFNSGTHMGGMVHDLLPQKYVDGIPSVYFYSKRLGRTLCCGEALKDNAIPEQNRLRYLKRKLGETVELDGKTISYDTAITEVVQYCLRIANQRLDQQLQFTTNLVSLSYPATYTCAQREKLIKLVEQATLEDGRHIKVQGTIAEPAAAALDYLAEEEKSGKETTVLTYDLGGGTFDLGLVSVYPNGRKRNDGSVYYYDIINTRGIGNLGGAEFDNVMYDLLSPKIKTPLDVRSKAKLKNAAEVAKVDLSEVTETLVSLEIGGEYIEVPITRREFENATKDLINQTIEATRGMLNDHMNQKPDVILLTGGASQMPMVKDSMERAFPEYKGKIKKYKPSMAIAYGAARYGTKEKNTDPKTSIVQKHLDYDIGVRFRKSDDDPTLFISTYLKAGTVLPCDTGFRGSSTTAETNSSCFRVFEANKSNPDSLKYETDYREIMKVSLNFGREVPKGYESETRLVADRLGLLRIEAREKEKPENTIDANVQLENLS